MSEQDYTNSKTQNNQIEGIFKAIKQNKMLPAIIACIVLFILGELLSPGYISQDNIGNIIASAGILSLAAAGQTLVILSGNDGIDMSVGQIMSLSAVASYMLLNGNDARIPLALIIISVVGSIIGFINGLGIVFAGLPPLIMTLGMSAVIQGIVFASNAGGTPIGKASPLLLKIASGRIFGPLRYLGIIGIIAVIVIELLLRKTKYGHQLYKIGNNRAAARLCGIPTNKIVLITYSLSGLLSALAGFFLLGYAGTANLDLGGSYTLLTIAAVVIGGTQLSGGEGGYIGTFIGAILLRLLTTVLVTVGLSDSVRNTLVGVFLMLTLLAYARAPKLRQ